MPVLVPIFRHDTDRTQPGGRTQKHARSTTSSLLIFERLR
jgi:hypothetical protein